MIGGFSTCIAPLVEVMFGEVSYTFFEDDIVGYVEVIKVGVSTSSFDVGVFGGMPLITSLAFTIL